jgi:hypothetical protein
MNFISPITVFASPDAYQAQYKPASGYEWSTSGLYEAPNRRGGAAVSFFINKQKKDTAVKQMAAGGRDGSGSTGKEKPDTALVKIYSLDAAGNANYEPVRTLRWVVDTGFNKMYWGMEEKGFRQPGSAKPKPADPEPGGYEVFPGRYKLVITYAKASDSTFITVKDDPRLGNRNDIKLAQRNMYDRVRRSTDKLITATDQLTESEEVLTKMLTQLKDLEGKEIDSLRRSTTKMQDEIKDIRGLINEKPNSKQGMFYVSYEETVMTAIQRAKDAIGSKMVIPGRKVEILVENAEKSVKDIVGKINNFYSGKWAAYRQQAEATKVNLFKDYKMID